MPAVGTLLQNHQTKGFYHHRRSSLCAFVSLSLSPSVCGCERLVLLLSFQKSTRVCSVRERVYASLMPSVDLTPVLRPIRITCYFFLHSIFLHHFNRCVFFNGIFFVRFVCNTFYSCFFSIFLSLSLTGCSVFVPPCLHYAIFPFRKSYSGVMVRCRRCKCLVLYLQPARTHVFIYSFTTRTHTLRLVGGCQTQSKDKQNEYYVI